jgi:hypothetical protein
MRGALRSLLRNDPKSAVRISTLKALHARGLACPSGTLTEIGAVYAASLCPLREQAIGLGIPLTEQAINRSHKRPEFDLLEHFRSQGNIGSFSEGGIVFILLYSIWFDVLLDCKRRHRKWPSDIQLQVDMMYDGRYNVFSYVDFVEACPAIHASLLEAIDYSTTAKVVDSYRQIERLQFTDTWWPYGYYGITEELFCSLFSILGRERLRRLAALFLQDCRLYSKGWPDLLIVDNDVARFIEVKTTDKLHISQIIVMPEMMGVGDLNFEIVKVVNRSKKNA